MSNEKDSVPKGLKLDVTKSKFAQQKASKESFTAQAEEAHEAKTARQQQAFNIGKQFIEVMRDKTLVINKGPLRLDLEREILTKVINLAKEINNDPNEEADGMGCISGMAIIFKSLLDSRDRLNDLEYKLALSEKQNTSLNSKVELLEKKLSSSREDSIK